MNSRSISLSITFLVLSLAPAALVAEETGASSKVLEQEPAEAEESDWLNNIWGQLGYETSYCRIEGLGLLSDSSESSQPVFIPTNGQPRSIGSGLFNKLLGHLPIEGNGELWIPDHPPSSSLPAKPWEFHCEGSYVRLLYPGSRYTVVNGLLISQARPIKGESYSLPGEGRPIWLPPAVVAHESTRIRFFQNSLSIFVWVVEGSAKVMAPSELGDSGKPLSLVLNEGEAVVIQHARISAEESDPGQWFVEPIKGDPANFYQVFTNEQHIRGWEQGSPQSTEQRTLVPLQEALERGDFETALTISQTAPESNLSARALYLTAITSRAAGQKSVYHRARAELLERHKASSWASMPGLEPFDESARP